MFSYIYSGHLSLCVCVCVRIGYEIHTCIGSSSSSGGGGDSEWCTSANEARTHAHSVTSTFATEYAALIALNSRAQSFCLTRLDTTNARTQRQPQPHAHCCTDRTSVCAIDGLAVPSMLPVSLFSSVHSLVVVILVLLLPLLLLLFFARRLYGLLCSVCRVRFVCAYYIHYSSLCEWGDRWPVLVI